MIPEDRNHFNPLADASNSTGSVTTEKVLRRQTEEFLLKKQFDYRYQK